MKKYKIIVSLVLAILMILFACAVWPLPQDSIPIGIACFVGAQLLVWFGK